VTVRVSPTPPPETLARRSGKCRLCHRPIAGGLDYVMKLEPIGWVHALCGVGYRSVILEHQEDEDGLDA
jgi:hypothetical protein